jgi:carbon storage regulator
LLVLSRKKGEKIRINDNIIIEILEVNGGIVKIGFTAPQQIKIYRDELYLKIVEENMMAKAVKKEEIDAILRELKEDDKV